MAIDRLLEGAAFGPEATQAMAEAYEAALRTLGILDPADPRTETIARRIISSATAGEDDPVRLCQAALRNLSG